MKISQRTVKRLGEVITGDKGLSPYRTGPQLVSFFNEFLAFDGYEIVPQGTTYNVLDKKRGEIDVDVKLEPSHLSLAFIMEQIQKCRTKISQADYDGAITNARSLVEAVLVAIEKEFDAQAPDYDGDLPKLYKRVQKQLNLSPENPKISNSLKQTLTGFVSIIGGLSGLSNKMRDRHLREYKPAQHHAVLIVNTAMTFSNFIFDTYAYQKTPKI
jgi:Abortive infection C-terminus